MMRLARLTIPFILALATQASAITKADATVVSSGPLAILLTEGKGATTFSIVVAGSIELPKIDATAAAAATGDTIQRSAFTISQLFVKQSEPQIVSVSLSVDTKQQPLAPNTAYSGKIVVFTEPLQEIAFSVTRQLSTAFDVGPKTMTTALTAGDDGVRPIRIYNTSTAPLPNVTITLFDFRNAKGATMRLTKAIAGQTATVDGRNSTADVILPYPSRAGTYSGVIEVEGPTGDVKTLSMTYTVRGPYGKFGIPLILFIVALLTGCALSYGLERRWSERRIEELEITRQLDASRHNIASALKVLSVWAKASAPLPKTAAAFDDAIEEIDDVKSSIGDKTSDELKRHAAASVNRARASRALVTEFDKRTPAKATADVVDTVLIDTPNYRDEIRRKISGGDVNQGRVTVATTATNIDSDLKRIRFVRWSVLMLVVALTAYQTFFSADPQFGSSDDYIKLFIWGLGLTQAGSQIITRVRSMPR
jgi:hypothetical protein